MKKIIFLFFAATIFSQCSSDSSSSNQSPDVEYNIDNVRILIPREFQKVTTEEEIKKLSIGQDSTHHLDRYLFDKMLALENGHHWFAKFDGRVWTYLILKTDGPRLYLSKENTDYLREQYEKKLEEKFLAKDSMYSFRNLDHTLTGAFAIKYYKLQYSHSDLDRDWYSTSYIIYANNRTIRMSIISPHKDHYDLENHMDFIRIN